MSVSVFAERLRNAMNSRGLKQVDLVHAAEHRGVKMGKSHISQYVAGKTMPREDVLEFLASELDVDMNWLRGEESTTQLNSDASNSVTDGEHAATPLATGASKPQTDSEIPVGRRRTFGKSHKLDNVLYDVRGPVADEAMRMEANGTHILKLNIGNPAPFGFRTPDEVVYDMAHQLTDTEGYSPSKGLFSARKAIMQYAQLKNIPNVTIDDIYTGNGVSELINLSMSALLDTGDEVLVPSPDYPLWTACVNLAGGTAVHYLCDEQSEWYPDIDDIRSKITSNTKAIVIINPNNPTGGIMEKADLEKIAQVVRETGILVISDEIYGELTYGDRTHISFASLPDMWQYTITLNGFSKAFAMTGWRVGYACGPKEILSVMLKIHQYSILCAPRMGQVAALEALQAGRANDYEDVRRMRDSYDRRRRLMVDSFRKMGLDCFEPLGAFYVFPSIKKTGLDSETFCERLLNEYKIATVPGTAFGECGEGHIRCSYATGVEKLNIALERMSEFVDKCGK